MNSFALIATCYWNIYETFIDANLNVNIPLQTKLDVDNALETLTNSIVEARSIAIPKCEVKFESVIIDDDLKLLIRLKNVSRRQFQRTRDPAMKIIWQDLQKEIKKCFTQLHNFENKISQLDPGCKPFWKLSKILKKPQKPISALKEENKLLLTNCEKAQKLAMQFESAHNFNKELTSPIENQVTHEIFSIKRTFSKMPGRLIWKK